MTDFRLSLYQYNINPHDPEANLQLIRDAASVSSQQESNLLILPELCLHGYNYSQFPTMTRWFFPSVSSTLCAIAKQASIAIAGSFVEEVEDRFYNTFVYIDATGKVRHTYQKLHLFNRLGEDSFFTAGTSISAFESSYGLFGAVICYDLRFPEVIRKLARKGSKLIIISAEWPTERIDHWKILLRARAIENQVFIAAVNCCGKTFKTEFGGYSTVIDPWGKVLCELSEQEGLVTIPINLDRVAETNQILPVWEDDKPWLY
ncbi:MAG: hypothetical protein C0391_04655 [Anaerolinea sp.]|nr:hypothetical protein [Anaerolinea sp.]